MIFAFFREADIEKELDMIASGQAPADDDKEDRSKAKGKKQRKKKEDDRYSIIIVYLIIYIHMCERKVTFADM